MRRLVTQFRHHQQIRELSLELTAGLRQKDFDQEARRLFDFVQNRIRYVRDIYDVETVQTPPKTLEYGAGDCDDKTTLLAALLESIGCPTKIVAVGYLPNKLQHVFLQALINGKWVCLDATEKRRYGWCPPKPVTVETRGPR